MNHLSVYKKYITEEYDIEEEYDVQTSSIGKPIACDRIFRDQDNNEYLLTIYDNATYCITYSVRREYNRVSLMDRKESLEQFRRIDPRFEEWVKAQIKEYYKL